MARVVVAGAGPAGLAAALWAHRLGLEAVVVERAAAVGGQLHSYSLPIVDLPGFGPASADQLMQHLADELDSRHVPVYCGRSAINWDGAQLFCADGTMLPADWLFYAPGLSARTLGVAGEQWVSSVSFSQLIDASPAQRILIVGAGDRAVEGALRLDNAGHQVTLLARSKTLRARSSYQDQLRQSGVAVLKETEPASIERHGDDLRVCLKGAGAPAPWWEGATVLVRIGMQPEVVPALALVNGDLAYARQLNMTVIGDAALMPWERSLVTAFASAMRAVKTFVQRMDML